MMSKQIQLAANPGVTGWQAILPPRKTHSELEGKIDADYLIIGAGFAGLSAARRLHQIQPDAKVVILEGCEIGKGPAGRNSGFMIDLPHDLSSQDYAGSAENDRQQTAINRSAIEFANDAFREYQMPSEALKNVGKINAAATAKGMRFNENYADHLINLDEPHTLLNVEDMKKITGTDYYQGGLWTPGTTILQPALYISSLADGLVGNANIHIFENTSVNELQKQKNDGGMKKWLAITTKGRVSATKVILAVNGMVERFGYFQKRLMHVFTYASMSRRLTLSEIKKLGGEQNWACTSADPMGTSVRRISGIGGDRLLVRNRATYDPSMEVSQHRINSVKTDHLKAFKARFPMLSDVWMDYTWGGRLCLSKNGVFAAGEVDEGLFSACCQNGLGTAKGTAIGIIAAECASNSDQSLVPDFTMQDPPEKLLPKLLMYLGANSYMRWKEIRAGKDK